MKYVILNTSMEDFPVLPLTCIMYRDVIVSQCILFNFWGSRKWGLKLVTLESMGVQGKHAMHILKRHSAVAMLLRTHNTDSLLQRHSSTSPPELVTP